MDAKTLLNNVQLFANLLELHGENSFKVRAFQNAYLSLKKLGSSVEDLSEAELEAIPGIGKSAIKVIHDFRTTGTNDELSSLIKATPPGVIEMMQIKGLGPKRVETFWKILGITDVGTLINECTENRLAQAKGFGLKSQQDLLQKAKLYQQSKGKLLYADAAIYFESLQKILDKEIGSDNYKVSGAFYRKYQIIDIIEILILRNHWTPLESLSIEKQEDHCIFARYMDVLPIQIKWVEDDLEKSAFIDSFNAEFAQSLLINNKLLSGNDEISLFNSINLPYMIPEMRWLSAAVEIDPQMLITTNDIKGLIHFHTTWSDGINSLEEMIIAAIGAGFHYAGVTDHSRSAGYAGGLSDERVLTQHEEIEKLQLKYPEFIILKGIESDILIDGSLDYSMDILASFDFIIGSVHSVLNMDKERATHRVIKAIENPYMSILGHPSGRLLLAREGYLLDYDKIFDACVANNVAIEINANPRRLDLDFTLIKKATDRGIMISINPDAHSVQGISDLTYGINAARAGGLLKTDTLNAFQVTDFLKKLKK